jgi:hypothetical protein
MFLWIDAKIIIVRPTFSTNHGLQNVPILAFLGVSRDLFGPKNRGLVTMETKRSHDLIFFICGYLAKYNSHTEFY